MKPSQAHPILDCDLDCPRCPKDRMDLCEAWNEYDEEEKRNEKLRHQE